MASILNNIKIYFIEKRIKNHQTKFEFNKNFLPIKVESMKNKFDTKSNLMDLKLQTLLLPYEIKAGIPSDFVKKEYEAKCKEIEETYYWKERELKQTIKRQNQPNEAAFDKLNNDKKQELLAAKSKFYITEPNPADVEEYHVKSKEIINKYTVKKTTLTEKSTNKISGFEQKINSIISKREKKIEELKVQLSKIEHTTNENNLEEGILLKLDELSMHFGGLKAVDKLSFEVKEGEIFGLIGPNGAGKTTVFNCITRFYRPTSGEMYFRNHFHETVDLNQIAVHNVIKEGIVRTFQNVEMIWELNVIENLLVAAHTKYRSGFFGHLFNSRLLRQEEVVMRNKAEKILVDLDLIQYAYSYPLGLPYGILKKIELARTLMVDPKLIILDEPAAGLNDSETDVLARTIEKIRKEYNTTIFLVEHDMSLVMDICDTVCAISFGQKLAIGTPKEIQSSKVVREAYLGGE